MVYHRHMVDFHMKIWLDDIRDAPDETWTVVRTLDRALLLLEGLHKTRGVEFEAISFDHDIPDSTNPTATSRPVLNWIIMNHYWPKEIFVHSSNPPGAEWLIGTAESQAPEGTKIRRVWYQGG